MDGQVLKDEGSENDWLVAKLVGDRYYIERQLGVGGMGVVYLAQHVYMSRRCALKVLRPELLSNPEAVGRFTREAQNASRISHPNVAAVYDFGEVSGELMYLAMEYVEGDSLAEVLQNEGRLPIARAAAIVAQVGSALKAAHELGIVHRDLKPDNIMLAKSGDAGDLVKVVDFGIARAVQEESQRVTSSGVVIGTPAYMSPEQLVGDKVDARSDLYSLGLVTYAMLVGQLPVTTDRTNLILRSSQPPLTLRDLDPTVDWPDELQAVMSRALAVEAADRQENVQCYVRELIDAIRTWQPTAIASTVSTLAILGADVTGAVPSELLVTWPTPPVEQPAIGATGPRTDRRLRVAAKVGGTLVAVAGLATIPGILLDRPAAQDRSVPAESVAAPPTVVFAPSSTSTPETSIRRSGNATARRSGAGRANGDRETAELVVSQPPPAGESVRLVAGDSAASQAATDTAIRDSAPSGPPPVPLATTGFVMIGPPGRLAAALAIGDGPFRVVQGLQTFEVPVGTIQIRVHLDRCQDWDSIVTIRPGDTTRVGYRQPTACRTMTLRP
ncbi:MAG TPA: protein kinase [Gemmatimonadaceae bacterium]